MKKTKEVKIKDNEYFDDCLVCQVMGEAEKQGKSLGQEELETVFAKQNLKNKIENNK
ncbi:hypothetical protein HYS92_00950 [Candidatus Daviesbacteria bacterium]|nr:hypothetical protein [Candidatus Daviesbacteria bacterium]